MSKFQSKKWTFLGARPTTLLIRQLRNIGHLNLSKISTLKASSFLIIQELGQCYVYIRASDEKWNNQQIKKEYINKTVEKRFNKLKRVIQVKKIPGKNYFEKAINAHLLIAPFILYALYLDNFLTKESNNLAKLDRKEQKRFYQLVKQSSQVRDLVKLDDEYYHKAIKYLKKKHPDYQDIESYLIEEILTGKKVSSVELKARKNFYVMITQQTKTALYIGEKARHILRKEGFKKIKISNKKELKGFSAQPGKVIGQVVVIKKESDFKKDYLNKILVSPMTIPQYTPYLKKVKAMVTDEGGVNCHAATVAREFKTPCIVGTKIATKVLKDGDLVEVDANKGVVKKL